MVTERRRIRNEVSVKYGKIFESLRGKTVRSGEEFMKTVDVKVCDEMFNINKSIEDINKLFRDFEQVLNEKVDAAKNENITINSSFLSTLKRVSDTRWRLSNISKSLLYIGKEIPRLILTCTHLLNKNNAAKNEMINDSLERSLDDSNVLICRMVEDINQNSDALMDKYAGS